MAIWTVRLHVHAQSTGDPPVASNDARGKPHRFRSSSLKLVGLATSDATEAAREIRELRGNRRRDTVRPAYLAVNVAGEAFPVLVVGALRKVFERSLAPLRRGDLPRWRAAVGSLSLSLLPAPPTFGCPDASACNGPLSLAALKPTVTGVAANMHSHACSTAVRAARREAAVDDKMLISTKTSTHMLRSVSNLCL